MDVNLVKSVCLCNGKNTKTSRNYLLLTDSGPTTSSQDVSLFIIGERWTNAESYGRWLIGVGGTGIYRYSLGIDTNLKLVLNLDTVTTITSNITIDTNAWFAAGAAIDRTAKTVTFWYRKLTGSDGVSYSPGTTQTHVVSMGSSNPVTGGSSCVGCSSGGESANAYSWDGRIAHPAMWVDYKLDQTDFEALIGGFYAGTSDPTGYGDSGDCKWWFSFEGGTGIDQALTIDTPFEDSTSGSVTATPKKYSNGNPPYYDVGPFLPRSFARPRSTYGRATPRFFPYPYKGGFIYSHDEHGTLTREDWMRLFRWMNTRATDSVHGAGLGIEVSSTYWPFVCSGSNSNWGPQNKFSYYQGLPREGGTALQKTADVETVRMLLEAGVIDGIHGYGDFGETGYVDYRVPFDPAYANQFIAELARHGLSLPKVFVNHGDSHNTHNIGNETFTKGDDSAADEYHMDQTKAAGGAEIVWSAAVSGMGSGIANARLTRSPDMNDLDRPPFLSNTWGDSSKSYVYQRYSPRIIYEVTDDDTASITLGTPSLLVVPDTVLSDYTYSAAHSVLVMSSSTNQIGHAWVSSANHNGDNWELRLTTYVGGLAITASATDVKFLLIETSYSNSSCFWGIDHYYDSRLLDQIETDGGLIWAYAHLGYYSSDPAVHAQHPDLYNGYTADRLAAAYAGMRALAQRYHDGTMFTAGLYRMFRYLLTMNQAIWNVVSTGVNAYRITIEPTFTDAVLGTITLTLDHVMGLTWYRPEGATVEVYLGDTPVAVQNNAADATGFQSVSIPWVKLAFPAFEGGTRRLSLPFGENAMYKNIAGQYLAVYAHDTEANGPMEGDAANITATIALDCGSPTSWVGPSSQTHPTERGGGIYIFPLTQAQTNCKLVTLVAASASENVIIEPRAVEVQDPYGQTVDGITVSSAIESLLAVVAGQAVPSGNAVAFKKRDGSTTKVTVTYGSTAGQRTGSEIAG
ncbi:MAG TPA: hypothetical protein PKY77_05835 [Phycisphaerae bacterium]|nr:hypothetical protein [Phycisphaerae bacterium]HRY69035.1 hypothetical protein [Phycisphaerae bacterium]HSA25990.1 hypothetical protein [Phycisphaerae bacterium]